MYIGIAYVALLMHTSTLQFLGCTVHVLRRFSKHVDLCEEDETMAALYSLQEQECRRAELVGHCVGCSHVKRV